MRREDPNKPTYATNIENILYWLWIQNNNANRVYYGILGVDVVKDAGYNFFHTSYNGQLAPGGVLQIDGNGCYGPGGGVCAQDISAGQWRDNVKVAQPGHYIMTLSICQSRFPDCTQPGGRWQDLSSVQFDAIDWTPTPPSVQAAPTATPAPEEQCHLIRDDPRGIYLRCRIAALNERALFR